MLNAPGQPERDDEGYEGSGDPDTDRADLIHQPPTQLEETAIRKHLDERERDANGQGS